jgi:hypothetical protein
MGSDCLPPQAKAKAKAKKEADEKAKKAKAEKAEEAVRSAKSAPEGIEAELAAKAEKRKTARAGFPTGVSLNKASGKYVAMISIGGGAKRIHLGYFATPEEAEEAIRSAKSAPEGLEAYIAARAEKRKAARGDLPTGVYLFKASGKYLAQISIDGKIKHLGSFATSEEAGEAYRIARLKNPSQSPGSLAAVAANL